MYLIFTTQYPHNISDCLDMEWVSKLGAYILANNDYTDSNMTWQQCKDKCIEMNCNSFEHVANDFDCWVSYTDRYNGTVVTGPDVYTEHCNGKL